MKRNLFTLLVPAILSCIFSASLFARGSGDKVIYGRDDRLNYSQASQRLRELADSTAGMVRKDKLVSSGRFYKFKASQFGGRYVGNMWENGPICMDENFSKEKTLTDCSGFLIAEDILVTAGHCVRDKKSCSTNKWIFGFTNSISNKGKILKSDTYSCKKILKRGDRPKDFAILKLDRKVEDRQPLRYSKSRVKVGDKLIVIGHPAGLPQKIAAGARVFKVGKNLFKTNLDTFAGSSGSAVFNEASGKVIGILVSGSEDFVKDEKEGCFRVNTCANEFSGRDCLGEGVTPISVIGVSDFIH